MYSIKPISYFQRDIKKLLKKYPNIHKDCFALLDQLEKGFFEDDKLQGFDNKILKARVGSSKLKNHIMKKQEELRKFDDELRHYADMKIFLDLDDGVKVNYGKFGNLLAETEAVTGKK